jgi:hypothetical protein
LETSILVETCLETSSEVFRFAANNFGNLQNHLGKYLYHLGKPQLDEHLG